MAQALTEPDIGPPPELPPVLPEDPRGDDDPDGPTPGASGGVAMTGIAITIAASVMTFASFVSAMFVRRHLATDWHHVGLPAVLWWNTIALVASSVALEVARRRLRSGQRAAFNRIWTAGTGLGAAFLIGQAIAWKQLADRGYYLAGNPSSAFFYVITWAHAAHVIGALAAVLYADYRALRPEPTPSLRTIVDVSTVFWHFLDVMWLGIMALFVFWA